MTKVKKFIKIAVIAICVFYVLRALSMYIPFNVGRYVSNGTLYDYIQHQIAWLHIYMDEFFG